MLRPVPLLTGPNSGSDQRARGPKAQGSPSAAAGVQDWSSKADSDCSGPPRQGSASMLSAAQRQLGRPRRPGRPPGFGSLAWIVSASHPRFPHERSVPVVGRGREEFRGSSGVVSRDLSKEGSRETFLAVDIAKPAATSVPCDCGPRARPGRFRGSAALSPR